jgi:putative SOS response-associated peptidase YedK
VCGRYTLTNERDLVRELDAALDPQVATDEWWRPRYNVAPTQRAPVVTSRDGARVVEMMRWVLLPFWSARPGTKPPLMINARVESIDAKAVFRDALARKRCLVPADGFFEWRRIAKKSAPLYFHPEPRHVIAFAGLWARVKTDAGEVHSFTIVTGPANELVAPIHDRMPIVLPRDAWSAWLDPGVDAAGAHALLDAPAMAGWRADPVSTRVNSANNDDPSCVEPSAQAELF